MGLWGCGAVTGAGLRWVGLTGDGMMGDGLTGDGPMWLGLMGNGPTGAIMGSRHYCMTSRMPSSAREEGFQICILWIIITSRGFK